LPVTASTEPGERHYRTRLPSCLPGGWPQGPGATPSTGSPHAILRRRAGRKGEAAGRSAAAATFWTLACAAIIAVYALIDAAAVRASGGTERYVAIVAALRETSVTFAALIGTWLLKEDQLRERIWGATAVLAGLIAPKL
jgi:hypothetical protein